MHFRLRPAHLSILKTIIHVVNITYISLWYFWAFNDNLGADPVKAIIHFTGMGALNLLLITLLVSPLARLSRQALLLKTRRLLGLYCFFWAILHFGNYLIFDLQMAFSTLVEDIIERPYITVGFISLCILTCLAATSPTRIRQKLKKHWQTLHNYVYPATLLIYFHFIWSLKSLNVETLFYGFLLVSLVILRLRQIKQSLRKMHRNGLSLSQFISNKP